MSNSDSEIQLRAGRADDAESAHALIQPFVRRQLLLERSVEELRGLMEHSVAAEVDGALVGFAAVDIYSRKLAEIQCLAVAEGYQDRGIGKQLVASCVAIASQHNVLELMAISSSEEFLQDCGFAYSLPGQKRAPFINP